MMVAVFATMALALVAARLLPAWIAIISVLASLAFATGLFLFEIYSPTDGFRMPWIRTHWHAAPEQPA